MCGGRVFQELMFCLTVLMILLKITIKTNRTCQWREIGVNLKIKISHYLKCFKLTLVVLILTLLVGVPTG